MLGGIPPPPGHGDPSGVRAAAEQDRRHRVALGHDFVHALQFVVRLVTWPVRLAMRLLRQ